MHKHFFSGDFLPFLILAPFFSAHLFNSFFFIRLTKHGLSVPSELARRPHLQQCGHRPSNSRFALCAPYSNSLRWEKKSEEIFVHPHARTHTNTHTHTLSLSLSLSYTLTRISTSLLQYVVIFIFNTSLNAISVSLAMRPVILEYVSSNRWLKTPRTELIRSTSNIMSARWKKGERRER